MGYRTPENVTHGRTKHQTERLRPRSGKAVTGVGELSGHEKMERPRDGNANIPNISNLSPQSYQCLGQRLPILGTKGSNLPFIALAWHTVLFLPLSLPINGHRIINQKCCAWSIVFVCPLVSGIFPRDHRGKQEWLFIHVIMRMVGAVLNLSARAMEGAYDGGTQYRQHRV